MIPNCALSAVIYSGSCINSVTFSFDHIVFSYGQSIEVIFSSLLKLQRSIAHSDAGDQEKNCTRSVITPANTLDRKCSEGCSNDSFMKQRSLEQYSPSQQERSMVDSFLVSSESDNYVDDFLPKKDSPSYLKNLPENICTESNRVLTERGTNFRCLMRKHCKLPGFCGPIIFSRLRQYKEITEELVREMSLPAHALDYIQGFSGSRQEVADISCLTASSVHLRDFLRFWTPEFRNQNRPIQFLKMLLIPTRESVLSLERDNYGFSCMSSFLNNESLFKEKASMDNLKPFVESLVDLHPDLVTVRNYKIRRQRYVTYVLISMFASMDGGSSPVTFKKLLETQIPNIFFGAATKFLMDCPHFNLKYFDELDNLFGTADKQPQIDSAGLPNTMLSLRAKIPTLVSRRLRSLCWQLSNGANSGNFAAFVWYVFMVRDQMSTFSLKYWFRALDLDDDGRLGREDLACLLREKLHEEGILDYRLVESEVRTGLCFIIDLVKPKRQFINGNFEISLRELRQHKVAQLLFERLFVDTSMMGISSGQLHMPLDGNSRKRDGLYFS